MNLFVSPNPGPWSNRALANCQVGTADSLIALTSTVGDICTGTDSEADDEKSDGTSDSELEESDHVDPAERDGGGTQQCFEYKQLRCEVSMLAVKRSQEALTYFFSATRTTEYKMPQMPLNGRSLVCVYVVARVGIVAHWVHMTPH